MNCYCDNIKYVNIYCVVWKLEYNKEWLRRKAKAKNKMETYNLFQRHYLMTNLQHRQSIIQEKRKQTSFRDFVMEIASWFPLNIYKHSGYISRYPDTDRAAWVKSVTEHQEYCESLFSGPGFEPWSSFLDSFSKLYRSSQPAMINFWGTENSDYCDVCYTTKNWYLSFNSTWWNENVIYSICTKDNCKDIYNSFMAWDWTSNCYQSAWVINWFNVFYSKNISWSNNVRFCNNLIGCSECLFCDSLENASYCIKNKVYSKDEYLTLKANLLSKKDSFDVYYDGVLSMPPSNMASVNCKGNFCVKSEDVENGYNVYQTKHWRNLIINGSSKWNSHMYDCVSCGSNDASDMYACTLSGTAQHLYCCDASWIGSNLYYCSFLNWCSFCLGCIGLKNKSYCILNKQYTKEDRYIEVDKIFWKMQADWSLWSFFPASMNPFYFNDTAAYLIDPSFTKEEVVAKWYLRRDEPIKVDIPAGVQTVKTSELGQFESLDANGKRNINDEILKKVILDEQGNAYRIIPMELEFLCKYELPLPRKHWLDRMKENFRIS
jgi:hypothetical protein